MRECVSLLGTVSVGVLLMIDGIVNTHGRGPCVWVRGGVDRITYTLMRFVVHWSRWDLRVLHHSGIGVCGCRKCLVELVCRRYQVATERNGLGVRYYSSTIRTQITLQLLACFVEITLHKEQGYEK